MRHLFAAAMIVAALPAAAGEFNAISSKDALRAIAAAGYSGVGGVTRNDPYYFAAGISPEGKRVRIAVDVRSGAIATVTPLARGAGATIPQPGGVQSYNAPRIQSAPTIDLPGYQGQPARKGIGVSNYPWTSDNSGPAPSYCRYRSWGPGC